MNTNDELMHYGVLGMKWGRRKGITTNSSNKNAKKSKSEQNSISRQQRLNKIRRGVAVANTALAVAVTLNSLRNTTTVSTGKAYTRQALKKTGKTKYSDVHADWSWADYAWDEVNRL